MIILASMALWFIALSFHALLQQKLCRILGLPALPHFPLHLGRAILPLMALYLCLQLGTIYGVLAWFGAASVAGILASLTLSLVSLHRMPRKKAPGTLADAF